jgi:hypothetical protein
MSLDFLHTKFDKANYMVKLLVAHATGNLADCSEHEILRQELISDPQIAPLITSCARTNRNLGSFWSFIKGKYGTYAEHRTYLSQAFTVVTMRQSGKSYDSSRRSVFNLSSCMSKLADLSTLGLLCKAHERQQ